MAWKLEIQELSTWDSLHPGRHSLQSTILWEERGMPIPLLQGCRHHIQGGTPHNTPARYKIPPLGAFPQGEEREL